MLLQTIAAMNLICQGTAAVDHSTSTFTPYGMVTTEGTATLDDSVAFRLPGDGTGVVRLPRRMLPTVTTSHDGGWFPLIHLAQDADEIIAQVRLNQFNKPHIRIDRVTGAVRIDGQLGAFSGQCRAVDAATERKF